MELQEYQKRAMTTCTSSSENFSYMFLNLVGEVGEFASKVAKAIRKDMWMINGNGKVLVGDAVECEKIGTRFKSRSRRHSLAVKRSLFRYGLVA